LEIGIVGALFGALLLIIPLVRVALHVTCGSRLIKFIFLFFVFFLFANIAESVLLVSGLGKAIYWVLISYFVHASQLYLTPNRNS